MNGCIKIVNLLEIDSHTIVEVSVEIAHAVFRDDHRRIVVAVLDPIQHASDAPWCDSKPRRGGSTQLKRSAPCQI